MGGISRYLQDCNGRRPIDIAMIRNDAQPSRKRMEIIYLIKAEENKGLRKQLQSELRHGEVGTIVTLPDSTPELPNEVWRPLHE